MRLATFNINGINQRFEVLRSWLTRTLPDVVCLQELKTESRHFPVQQLREIGYDAIWLGEKSWNGVAILSKSGPLIETRRGLPGSKEDAQSRYVEAAVNGLIVGCLYLPNGNPQPGPKFDYKLAWFERLQHHARSLIASGHPVALCGDYNVVPTDFDIYNTRSWKRNALLQPESRAAYADLLEQGWTDALRTAYPKEPVYTFWDYFRNHWQTNSGLRIDHILLSPSLAPRLANAGVDREVRGAPHASDHAPVWVALKDEADAPASAAAGRTRARPKRAGKTGASSRRKRRAD